ncbi:MAG: polyprenyl synthetase family protein, partial [Candidatus Micrarchaeaceae archaeon]
VPAGNAFQIKDDILDCSSTEEALGKSIGTDVRAGTKTLILWHTVQNASESTLKKLQEIYSKPPKQKSAAEIKWVLDTFKELGSIEYAEKTAKALLSESLEKFTKATASIPDSKVKRLAIDALGHSLFRQK